LAASHRTNVEIRDVKANYNKHSVAALSKKHPNINWNTLLNGLGVNADSVNARIQQVIDQYTVLDSVHLKGALIVGKNTADLAGVAKPMMPSS
jgi:putative endopeptidase